ncbi:MAG: homocysteine S-methyltransferase family protein [Ignavibacteriaceae bacterium]|nr:homocysteine S-methyltransferase family protein [Ignavibacteriaceae bacterium]
MKPILDRLKNGEVLVADGAMGTMLFQRGLKSGECPELFNLTHPEILTEIASLYFQAGADIIQTNTFGGSPLKLSNYQLEAKTKEINQTAVSIVKKVVDDKAYVSGSCGPSGEILEPYGNIEEETMYNSFKEQISALINAGVDLICIETMTDLQEIMLAIKAVKSVSLSTPVMATMTFEKIPKGFYSIMGVNIEKAVEGLTEAGADIIGSNCGHGIDDMIEIAKQIKTISSKPVVIQSNAGLPEYSGNELVYRESPSYFAEKTVELIEAGVSIIGGCCGTTPEHISAIRKVVDSTTRIKI